MIDTAMVAWLFWWALGVVGGCMGLLLVAHWWSGRE